MNYFDLTRKTKAAGTPSQERKLKNIYKKQQDNPIHPATVADLLACVGENTGPYLKQQYLEANPDGHYLRFYNEFIGKYKGEILELVKRPDINAILIDQVDNIDVILAANSRYNKIHFAAVLLIYIAITANGFDPGTDYDYDLSVSYKNRRRVR